MDQALPVPLSATGRQWVWRARPLSLEDASLAGADALATQLLLARGCPPADLARTLRPTLRDWLPDPSLFADMDVAARRLADAVQAGERVALFADYDVDGATSAAILARTLSALAPPPRLYIPDRLLEGYGPSADALLRLGAEGARLILVLDCGTQAHEPLAAAARASVEIIVVDHHKADTRLPPAVALVNPHRLDESAEARAAGAMLCTAGLAFLLAVALVRELRRRGAFAHAPAPDLARLLDLAALGTVADVMPLTGVNRALVALGLRRMARRETPGLAALADVAGLARAARADDLGFHFGPRINAGGRVGTADLGVRLLTTDCPDEARRLAHDLDRLNEERRAIERAVTDAALEAARARPDASVALVAGAGWHPGVVGIAASRLKDALARPALVLALSDDGLARGSGRSVPGVDLGAAILAAREAGLLMAGGGHAMACGLTVEASRIPELAAFLDAHLAPALASAGSDRTHAIDLSVTARGACLALADALEACGPWGHGWPAPRVAVGPVRLVDCAPVGRDDPRIHLRFVAAGPDGGRLSGIAFRALPGPLGTFLSGLGDRCVHLAGRLGVEEWQGRREARLQLDDAAPAG